MSDPVNELRALVAIMSDEGAANIERVIAGPLLPQRSDADMRLDCTVGGAPIALGPIDLADIQSLRERFVVLREHLRAGFDRHPAGPTDERTQIDIHVVGEHAAAIAQRSRGRVRHELAEVHTRCACLAMLLAGEKGRARLLEAAIRSSSKLWPSGTQALVRYAAGEPCDFPVTIATGITMFALELEYQIAVTDDRPAMRAMLIYFRALSLGLAEDPMLTIGRGRAGEQLAKAF